MQNLLDDIKPEDGVDEPVLMLIKQLKETSEELDEIPEEENESAAAFALTHC